MIENINTSQPNDGLGDKLRDAFIKVNNNFNELILLLDEKITQTELDDAIDIVNITINDIYVILDSKSDIGHTHIISEIQGLQSVLNGLTPLIDFNSNISLINNNLLSLQAQINNFNQEVTNLTYGTFVDKGVVISSTGTDAIIPLSTIEDAGLMSPEDKIKLDNISTGTTITNTSELINDGSDGTSTYVEADDIISITNTSELVNDGSDGIHPFLTASDMPQANKIENQNGYYLFGANTLTMNSGWYWLIQNTQYTNLSDVTLYIPSVSVGNKRTDIIVATTNNTFEIILGSESTTTAIAPPTPNNTLLALSINSDENEIVPASTPIGGDYITKFEKNFLTHTVSGEDLTIDIFQYTNNYLNGGIISISDFKFFNTSLTRIDHQVYVGKEYIFYNKQATDITLKHNTGSNIKMQLVNNEDYFLKPFESVRFLLTENEDFLQIKEIEAGGITTIPSLQEVTNIGNSTTNSIKIDTTSGATAELRSDLLTTDKQFQFPNTSGTLALTSDLSLATSPVFKQANLTTNANDATSNIYRTGTVGLIGSSKFFGTSPSVSDFTNETAGTLFGHVFGGGTAPFVQLVATGSNGGNTNVFVGRFSAAPSTNPQMTFTTIKNSGYGAWNDAGRLLYRFKDGYVGTSYPKLDIGTDYIQFHKYPSTRNDSGTTMNNVLFTDGNGMLKSKPVNGILNVLIGSAPSTPTSAGNVGEYFVDESFLYYCYSPNNWRRIASTTW